MRVAEFFLQRPNFLENLAENICHELATLCTCIYNAGKHVPRAVFVDLEPTVIDEVGALYSNLHFATGENLLLHYCTSVHKTKRNRNKFTLSVPVLRSRDRSSIILKGP
jgi:hypothetical protein